MKEFRLKGWAELPATYHRAAFRRAMSDMSCRHVSTRHLVSACGLSRSEVHSFLGELRNLDLLDERAAEHAESLMTSLRPWGGRIMKVLTTDLSRL